MTPEQLRDHLYGKWDVRDTIRRRAIGDTEDKDVEDSCAKYRRHTVDIRQLPPRYVEDEMLVVERGYRRAKWMWVAGLIITIASVVYQLT